MKTFIKALLIAFIMSFSSISMSEGLVISVGTIHTAESKNQSGNYTSYNSFNPGLGYETKKGYEFGFFRNSHYTTSLYALKRQPLIPEWKVNYSLGLVTGYNDTVFPLVTMDRTFFRQARVLATIAPIRAHSPSDGLQLVIGLQITSF